MTMDTTVLINQPVNPEKLFFSLIDRLESLPTFVPAWESPDSVGPWKVTRGPLRRGKATYKHVTKGEPRANVNGDPICHATTGEQFTEDDSEYRSTLGQGLAALVEVTYAEDAPLRWWEPDEGDDPTDPGCQPHLVRASFDTAYGLRLANGAGCADLHALLLRDLFHYLDALGCSDWTWMHEERGSWHGPTEWAERGDADAAEVNW